MLNRIHIIQNVFLVRLIARVETKKWRKKYSVHALNMAECRLRAACVSVWWLATHTVRESSASTHFVNFQYNARRWLTISHHSHQCALFFYSIIYNIIDLIAETIANLINVCSECSLGPTTGGKWNGIANLPHSKFGNAAVARARTLPRCAIIHHAAHAKRCMTRLSTSLLKLSARLRSTDNPMSRQSLVQNDGISHEKTEKNPTEAKAIKLIEIFYDLKVWHRLL